MIYRGYKSDLGKCPIIGEETGAGLCGGAVVDGAGFQATGFADEPLAEPPSALCGPADIQLIPESEWRERIEERERTGNTLSALWAANNLPVYGQGSTNYCWMNGPTQMVVGQRAKNGFPFVYLSPASVAAKVTSYKNRGGWASDAIRGMNDYGQASTEFWPANAISRQYDTPEARENAELHKAPEFKVLPPDSFEYIVSASLNDYFCTLGLLWWGHLVLGCDAVILPNGDIGFKFLNSWTDSYGENGFGVLTRQKATPDEAIILYSPTPSLV